ncbi:hypothetical protein ACH4UR_35775 [Streptomyces lydicus]|uniref:hypothetical protein n=1 Tax=Streptomyces lydicus TaxID=47763 RepID=UPI0033CF201D
MTTQSSTRHHWCLGLVAAAVLGALTVTACGHWSSTSAGGAQTPAPAPSQTLRLGQPSAQAQEISRYDKTGKFIITPQKVAEGTPQDLRELGYDPAYARQKIVWIYVSATHVGGERVKGPAIMVDIGAETSPGERATPLLLIGDLSGRPKDCHDEDPEAYWRRGQTKTACAPYLIPTDAKVTKVTYSQGYYQQPLAWLVPQR